MDYNFSEIERKWQERWKENKTYKTFLNSEKPKFYALDMFPYPSGAGLHVGHPLGYIASDIVARYKKLKGFNVLHPMGFDSFGLPAEQYAIQTGQHPKDTTEKNISVYKEQLNKLGFSFDWDREVKTSDPDFFKWTQWIFIKLFHSWYNKQSDKAEPIQRLINEFEKSGNKNVNAVCGEVKLFSDEEWKSFEEKEQQEILLNYRLAFLSEAMVNWCPQLGTVLANEEVKDGVSERGGYPVERKLMKQWSLRITAYAERLLKDLETIDWPESLKEAQRNWIGKSEGSTVKFDIQNSNAQIEVFTTRPDTIFGACFLTLAPEHELIKQIVTTDRKKAVLEYIQIAKNRSERERQADVKKISGEFTGAYAIHPFTQKPIPIWVGDYVLATYGSGAVMAVPAHDARDYSFAKYFNLPIIEVVKGGDITKEAYDVKEGGELINSDFLNGLNVKSAITRIIDEIEKRKLGNRKINYRLRDAVFGRQRYWGEPIPIYYKEDIPYTIDEKDLPLELPQIDKYLPTDTGEPPLARAKDWKYKGKYEYEYSTMPGWAGSSWYYLRYMDPENDKEFASKEDIEYWQNVDLYIGGAEHATGHLLYVRFWTKFLFDLNLIPKAEPAKKLINQGMIQGRSSFVYRVNNMGEPSVFISKNKRDEWKNQGSEKAAKKLEEIGVHAVQQVDKFKFDPSETIPQHISIDIVNNDILDRKKFKEINPTAKFITEDDNETYICGWEIEKMSKSKGNVVNPDEIVGEYGADTLRMYEMFLGPLEQSKPWDTNGIDGVYRFLRKFWRLYHNSTNEFYVSEDIATKAELKVLHKTIKKVEEDIERFSFNTSVSTFMICVNELTELKCNKRIILEALAIIISPYAPHICEELWSLLGNKESITKAKFPEWKEEYLVENSFEYPVSFNGKTRFRLNLPLSLTKDEIEKEVMASEEVKKWLEGKAPKKLVVVPGRIVNIVT